MVRFPRIWMVSGVYRFKTQADAVVAGAYWFVAAKVSSKTSYQRTSAFTDKEERTFDMHVRIEARNQDMPAGTERILTILENSIHEKTEHKLLTVAAHVLEVGAPTAHVTELDVETGDFDAIKANSKFSYLGIAYEVTEDPTAPVVADPTAPTPIEAVPGKIKVKSVTGEVDIAKSIKNKSIDLTPPPTTT